MAGSTWGLLFKVTTAGVSHGPGYLCIIDGCPSGMPLNTEDLLPDLRRRKPGQSKYTTQRQEDDSPEIISGVYAGKTDGTPIGLLFRNNDQRSFDYDSINTSYRPGHADFTFDAKYGFRDPRGGGRSSARETICRVAAGAVARKLLSFVGISVVGYVTRVGDVEAHVPDPVMVTQAMVESNAIRCPDPVAADAMAEQIDSARKSLDSIGGIAEIVAVGVPPGWGEPVFDKLKADLAKALMSLPAVVGFEYGAGFATAKAKGSQNNDHFEVRQDRTWGLGTKSNRHGGILGGISSGEPLIMRVALKPTSSIPQPQPSVNRNRQPIELVTKGRHDPCLLPRFVPMGEAMVMLTLVDHWLRHRAVTGIF